MYEGRLFMCYLRMIYKLPSFVVDYLRSNEGILDFNQVGTPYNEDNLVYYL